MSLLLPIMWRGGSQIPTHAAHTPLSRQVYPTPIAFDLTICTTIHAVFDTLQIGATKSDYGVLSKPLTGDPEMDEDAKIGGTKGTNIKTRLYFAGEATSMSDSYTVHGAYMSGQKQAERIAKWWREHAEVLIDEE